jgi:transcriptional regulator with XRE-family HTH domain
MKDFYEPHYRRHLKAKIITCGFRTLSQYAEVAGVDASRISRIITGWENPSFETAKKMAAPLNINTDELGELLFGDDGCTDSSESEAKCTLENGLA